MIDIHLDADIKKHESKQPFCLTIFVWRADFLALVCQGGAVFQTTSP